MTDSSIINAPSKNTPAGTIPSERVDLLLITELVPPQAQVLDIGCGTGDLLDVLQQQKQVDGCGLELSQKGVNACVARGLNVIQGDADIDLQHYPEQRFDIVILSQTLQATQHPAEVLRHMARIGRKLIVSIPNFGHWRVRLDLLWRGRMPVTKTLDASWHTTQNIHLCTLHDFNYLCHELDLQTQSCTVLQNGRIKRLNGNPGAWYNFFAEQAIYVLAGKTDAAVPSATSS